MGYTHYWDRKREIDSKIYKRIVEDFNNVLIDISNEHGKQLLYGSLGTGEAVINDTEVIFNGDDYAGLGHETFWFPVVQEPREFEQHGIENKELLFNFCKTAQKPYDIAVTAFLIIAKQHIRKDIRVSSDGSTSTPDEWQSAMKLCQEVLGYGGSFRLD